MPVDYGHRLSGTELDDLVSYILREAALGTVGRMRSLMPRIERAAAGNEIYRGIGST